MNELQDDVAIYIVDSDTAAAHSLGTLLNNRSFETISCTSGEKFLATYQPQRKAIIVLDLNLSDMCGQALQSRLNDVGISAPIIVLTSGSNVATAVQSMRDGATDFIEKPASDARILEAIEAARGMLLRKQPSLLSKGIVADRLAKLTVREREVLDHLLLGKLNKEIASELDVSQRTVEGHRSRIREKMQARGVADLIRMLS